MRKYFAASVVMLVLTVFGAGAVSAGLGDCGQPLSVGNKPNASDALFTLKAAVGSVVCLPWVCSVDGNGTVTAGDALRILKFAVGQAVTLACPLEPTTTTSTSSTTTTLPAAFTWTQVQAVFEANCSSELCHGAGASQGGMSDLDDFDKGYTETVNADSECEVCKASNECSGDYSGSGCQATVYAKRVLPGDPDGSFLIRKLEGTGDCKGDVGSCAMPMLADPLPQETIDGIRAWIAAGAPKN